MNKTLTELEGQDWGEPNFQSGLVINCHRLRRVPLNRFTVEDTRLIVGQGFSLPYLMPMALQLLQENPLAEGDFYPGDLLSAVLRQKVGFWREHPDWFAAMQAIIKGLSETPKEIKREVAEFRRMIL